MNSWRSVPQGRAYSTLRVPAPEMQKQLRGDLSCKANAQNWKGWLKPPLATDWVQFPRLRHQHSLLEVGMLNLGLRCAFRWNYPWTTTQEKPDGKLEKCTIPVSAWSGEHRSTSELWGGMWTDILGSISLRWWICPVTCAVLWDKRSCFRHTFYFKVHKVAKKI